MQSYAPQVHPFQTSSFLLVVSCSLGIWIGFRVLKFLLMFNYFGSIGGTEGGGNANKRCLYEQYQLQLEALNSSEVVSHKLGLQGL